VMTAAARAEVTAFIAGAISWGFGPRATGSTARRNNALASPSSSERLLAARTGPAVGRIVRRVLGEPAVAV
jgi:hypothetical protein